MQVDSIVLAVTPRNAITEQQAATISELLDELMEALVEKIASLEEGLAPELADPGEARRTVIVTEPPPA